MFQILIAIVGAIIGAAINWCIYNLGYDRKPVSPWSKASDGQSRNSMEYVPIVGWMFRKAEEEQLGKRFWLRPLFIELAWAIVLPFFYGWLQHGGLTEGVATPTNVTMVWFVGYTIMFALLSVATFIDFDQRIIPDTITVTGTIIALIIAGFYPSFRLPVVSGGLGGMEIRPLHFGDGGPLPTWHPMYYGLLVAILIAATWALALLPKFSLQALNWKSLKIVIVSTVRFLQKNKLKRRMQTRRTGINLLILGAVLIIAIAIGWSRGGAQWESLFGAVVGLGFGGMMVWLVRIVASHSLGREAMGFGDVTLMAMIGAFLGWQSALITFALSPFAALAIVFLNALITKENELAFGPYLCLGAVINVLCWTTIWPLAHLQFFRHPKVLMIVLAVSLVALGGMLLCLRWIRGDEPDIDQASDGEHGEAG